MADKIPVHHDVDLKENTIHNGKSSVPTAPAHIVNKEYTDEKSIYNTVLAQDLENSFVDVGGIKQGDTVNGKTVKELLDNIFFPDIPVTWTEFNAIMSVSNNLKIGEQNQSFQLSINSIMGDRPIPITSANVTVSLIGGGVNTIPVILTPNGTVNANISVPVVFPALSIKLNVSVDAMQQKTDMKGNIVQPPIEYQTSANLIFDVPVEALFPYVIHAYDLGSQPDYLTMTYEDIRAISEITDRNFCKIANAQQLKTFLQNTGPFSFLVALADSSGLDVLINGIGNISSTFTKINRTFTLYSGVLKQYQLYVHQTGVVPWTNETIYNLKRL